ncbi:sensor histidine kinase [Streptacidiphilus sp. MAP12-16]|uniref:sensor histidine kinase n=1 Tax=Streptacidiphilus sp. MAP12-16 TaxID=3156300 RepID=UPI0035129D65
MKREDAAKRLEAFLRAVPRILREDLVTTATDPVPRSGQSRQPADYRPALTVPLTIFAVVMLVINANEYAFRYQMGLQVGILLAGIQSAAVVVVLYRPVPAWWASTAVPVLVALFADGQGAVVTLFPVVTAGMAVQTVVLFLLALRVRLRIVAETLAISILVGLLCDTFLPLGPNPDASRSYAIFAIAVVVGASLRGRRVARSQLVVQEEITAEERARRTLLEERNRIARELHDVVAHHMSVISIQAQVAPHLVEDPSEELMENLAGIRQNAVEALTELRRVLGVLRSEDPVAEGARNAPQPTLDRLDELVGNVRGAGLTVTVETTGVPRPLSPGVELSAFRIVQEALSNAIRHAPGAAVRVLVAHQPASLTVRVTNTAPDSPAAPSPGAGHGLLGMRERTAMLGGELATGSTPDGGYEVVAVLPLEDSA